MSTFEGIFLFDFRSSLPRTPSTSTIGTGSDNSLPMSPEPPFLPNDQGFSLDLPEERKAYVPMLPNPIMLIRQKLFSCNRNKEINRRNFTLDMLIGTGHFGKVFKGIALGLEHPQSKTCVAVKTANDASKEDEILSLVCEAEIMSNLKKHLNLVNLLALCSSQFASTGELWLLLEYCNEGDMKSYLRKIHHEVHRNESGK